MAGLNASRALPLKLAALPACIIDAELVATDENSFADFRTISIDNLA
jgi:hypothetical protein